MIDKRKVLIVEDEVLVAFEMAASFKDMGFEVVGPSTRLEDAKQTAKTAQIDIAFLDVNLGRGDTSEPVAQILRERDIPFVFVTAYTRDQIGFCKDAERIVQKPVCPFNLVAAAQDVLPSSPL